jgi:5-methylcytosine-specific restriction endonuclease McrA
VEVHRVANAGRTIPASIRSALEARDVTCSVPGCNKKRDLEIDHIVPLAEGGDTSLDNLARLCRWHHAQKTHHGWRLDGPPGDRRWVRSRTPVRSG